MWRHWIFSLLFVALVSAPQPRAETLVSSDIGSNIFVYLKVDSEAAQALLPKAWTLKPWAKGAWAGANLMLIFVESLSQRGADGEALRKTAYRGLTVITWGETASVSWRIFAPRAYGTDLAGVQLGGDRILAEIRREMYRAGAGSDLPSATESWRVAVDGGQLDFEMDFTARPARYSEPTGRVADPGDPDGPGLIFRIKQLSYMVRGLDGVDTVSRVELRNSIPELAPLFDGGAEILAIRLLPVKLTDRFTEE